MTSVQNIRKSARFASFAVAATMALASTPSVAAETTVVTGVIGSYASGVWPLVIAMKKGMFAKHEIKPDVIFVPTGPGLVQQLAAGSLDFVAGVGVVEPIHAVEKGAPVALMRLVGQSPNYEMLGNKNIADLKALKGKKIAIGGLRDNNKIYLDRVMIPNGLKDTDYDIIVIGSTSARLAALQSGAIDATMLVPPFNFTALKLGYKSLALVRDYAKDLPQTGMAISKRWATGHQKEAKAINESIDDAVAWFYDPKNRDEAIDMMAEASKTGRQEVADSYDYLVKIEYFAKTSKISKGALNAWMKEMVGINDMKAAIPVESLLIPGLGEVTD
jgi:NitT/TauT family transport system substrate-binding protein